MPHRSRSPMGGESTLATLLHIAFCYYSISGVTGEEITIGRNGMRDETVIFRGIINATARTNYITAKFSEFEMVSGQKKNRIFYNYNSHRFLPLLRKLAEVALQVLKNFFTMEQ